MKVLTFKRLSILSLVLLAASAATAFIAKDKNVVAKNGHLTAAAAETSTADTCRTPDAGDAINCHDTQDDASSSGGGTALTGAAATSDGAGDNTSGLDDN